MNKKIAAAFAAASLAFGALSAPPLMAAGQTAQTLGSVNLREQPSTASSILDVLAEGETVGVLQQVGGSWLKVQTTAGEVGYLSASPKYISFNTSTANSNSGNKSAAATLTPSGKTSPATTGTASGKMPAAAAGTADNSAASFHPNAVITSSISFRDAPSTSGNRMRYLKKSERVEIIAAPSEYWFEVKDASGRTGFVSSDSRFITTGPTQAAPATSGSVQTEQTASKTASAGADKQQASQSKKVDTGSGKQLSAPSKTGSTSTGKQQAASSKTAGTKDAAPSKASLTGGSAKQENPAKTVSADAANTLSSKESASDKPLAAKAVIASTVSLREGPSTSTGRMRFLQKGEKVEIIAVPTSYWYQVKDSQGKTGYVSSEPKYITVTGTLPEAARGSGNAAAASSQDSTGSLGASDTATNSVPRETTAGDRTNSASASSQGGGGASVSAPSDTTPSKPAAGSGIKETAPSKTTAAGGGSSAATPAANIAAAQSPADTGGAANAVIASSVSLREGPSTSTGRIRYLKKGEQVEIIAVPTSYWYQVKDSAGRAGYVSSDSKYITVNGALPDGGGTGPAGGTNGFGGTGRASGTSIGAGTAGSGNGGGFAGRPAAAATIAGGSGTALGDSGSALGSGGSADGLSGQPGGGGSAPAAPSSAAFTDAGAGSASPDVEALIAAGMKYLGTPYEYGSSRLDTSTFDCSDFVRQAFMDGLNMTLPADSRSQGQYVRDKGGVIYDWHQLKRGDLLFFGDYAGNKPADYSGIDPDKAFISHVAIYLGDGNLLHTFSKASGGVKVTENIEDTHWDYRFLYGGSAL